MGGKGQIEISTRNQNNGIEISIKDDGPGIPANIMDKLFDPFFTTKEVGKGTGLGLSISHGIIEKHGGNIAVKSPPATRRPDGQGQAGEVGMGSEFIVTLPYNK